MPVIPLKCAIKTKDGTVKLVASGFINPAGVRFVDNNRLWVTDINGDFIGG